MMTARDRVQRWRQKTDQHLVTALLPGPAWRELEALGIRYGLSRSRLATVILTWALTPVRTPSVLFLQAQATAGLRRRR